MRDILNGFLLAISYFTIFTINIKKFKESKRLYLSTLFSFPLIGVIFAILLYFIFETLTLFYKEYYIAIFCSLIYFILYGFLHLDALADIVDAYFASFSNKNIYEVLKDSHIGAMGVCSLIIFIALKTLALYEVFLSQNTLLILIIAFTLSRFSITVLLLHYKPHQKSIFANALKDSLSKSSFLIVTLFIFSFLILLTGVIKTVTIFSITYISTLFIAKKIENRFGFINGDVIGFNIEIIELILLNTLLLLLQN